MKTRIAGALFCALLTLPALAADQPQWGQPLTRNMVSAEKNLPAGFDPATGRNIRWTVDLGNQNYATPTVRRGRVLIGANNEIVRDRRHEGDRGVLLCLDEETGDLRWQLVVPKLEGDKFLDWPLVGMVSPPTIDGDRVYVVTNRAEVACLDLDGFADGNDGPYLDEAAHMTPQGADPMTTGPLDADIVWLFDMRDGVGIWPHDETHASILLHQGILYVNSCNGVDNTHRNIRRPDAPSLIALDAKTGRLLAQDAERIGPRIFHCTWSSPALAEVAGRDVVFFGGADGVLYAFEALGKSAQSASPVDFELAWRYDGDPNAPKENVHEYSGNRDTSPSAIMGMPVFHDGRVYVALGGDIWWGKRDAWLKCVKADAGSGDVSASAEIWSAPLDGHCSGTPAIHDGLLYIGDCGRVIRCLDIQTGATVWTHEAQGQVWASALVADGKVYIGDRRGHLFVFAAGREKNLLADIELDGAISGSVVAANATLYVATMRKLYAVAAAEAGDVASR